MKILFWNYIIYNFLFSIGKQVNIFTIFNKYYFLFILFTIFLLFFQYYLQFLTNIICYNQASKFKYCLKKIFFLFFSFVLSYKFLLFLTNIISIVFLLLWIIILKRWNLPLDLPRPIIKWSQLLSSAHVDDDTVTARGWRVDEFEQCENCPVCCCCYCWWWVLRLFSRWWCWRGRGRGRASPCQAPTCTTCRRLYIIFYIIINLLKNGQGLDPYNAKNKYKAKSQTVYIMYRYLIYIFFICLSNFISF